MGRPGSLDSLLKASIDIKIFLDTKNITFF